MQTVCQLTQAPVIGCDTRTCPQCQRPLSFDASGHPFCRNCQSAKRENHTVMAFFERRKHGQDWERVSEQQVKDDLSGHFVAVNTAVAFIKTGERVRTAAATYRYRRVH